METPTKSIVSKVYPKRDPWTHKGEYGRLLIISGSTTFSGAAAIVGLAAMRSGADMTFLAGPKKAMTTAMSYSPTFITKPLSGDYLDNGHMREIFDFAREMRVNAMAIGPGLWRNNRVREAVLKLIDGFDIPMVIDADAIRALSAKPQILKGKNAILTPHSNEFKEFTGVDVSNDIEDRVKLVKEAAKDCGATIILKGSTDVISDGKKVALNKTGNSNMAKAGFGDILVGVCGALLSRRVNKVSTYDAACAAAYINGKAGDLAAKEKFEGLIVKDAIEKIPEVLKSR